MIRLLSATLLALVPILAWQPKSWADPIPLLIKSLGDENVRQGASISLAKQGEAAVPALRKSLKSGKRDVRVWCAYTLGQMGQTAEAAVVDLCQVLEDSDDALRAAAAEALGKIGAPSAVNALCGALEDENDRVRRHAVVALGQIGAASHSAAAKLVAALGDHHVRTQARDALCRIGPATVDQLVDSLEVNDIRFDVANILKTVAPARAKQLGLSETTVADLPSLRLVLHDVTRRIEERASAADSLAALGEQGATVLIAAFEDPQIARVAASAFSKSGPSSVPSLVTALENKRADVRAVAAAALGQMGSGAGDAAPELIGLLKDEDRNVRYQAVRALHEFGPGAKPAVAALTEVVTNTKELEPTRQWAIKTLVVTLPDTHDAVVKALVEGCKEETNYGVKQLARQHLLKLDPKAAEAAGIK